MQIRNNYDKEVFNGDLGYVETVSKEDRTLMVNFEDRLVEYEVSELDELSLAYAIHNLTVSNRNTKLKERLQ